MFNKDIYIERRRILMQNIGEGIILLTGNNDSPMNYKSNYYNFRQDSSFLYYIGIDHPGLNAIIDADINKTILFADDVTIEDMVWTGYVKPYSEIIIEYGIDEVRNSNEIFSYIKGKEKYVKFLPQYRYDNMLFLEELLGIKAKNINQYVSEELKDSVIEQRLVKSDKEIDEIEKALDISYAMNAEAIKTIKPGLLEREVKGKLVGISELMGNGISFPVIFSINGHILHNHYYGNLLEDGKLAVLDSGAESLLHYASDITRTYPVNGKFTEKQKDIYNIVLGAQLAAINEMRPETEYRYCHLTAAKKITEGLKSIGIMKGNIDDAVNSGAHALFFPHGLGHAMGLDVHDLEGVDETLTGYGKDMVRSKQFGLSALRFARKMKKGFVLTVEPGIYFIPQLIEKWQEQKTFSEFINFDKLNEYLNFGGIRIEDDVLITENGKRVLGKPIPKTVDDIEKAFEG